MRTHLPYLLVAAILSTSCVPVMVGGLIAKSASSDSSKREFTNNFQRVNMERERAGLRALDWCSEQYKFDAGWAANEPECRRRIQRYQAGDRSALDMTPSPLMVRPDSSRHDSLPPRP